MPSNTFLHKRQISPGLVTEPPSGHRGLLGEIQHFLSKATVLRMFCSYYMDAKAHLSAFCFRVALAVFTVQLRTILGEDRGVGSFLT